MIARASIRNSPCIGVYAAASPRGFAVVSPAAERGFTERLRGICGLRVIATTIGQVSAVGAMTIMNSAGAALPVTATDEEVSAVEETGLEVARVESGLNSMGNLVCANDYGAVASPLLPNGAVEQLKRILGVRVTRLRVAGYHTVGSVTFATNTGTLTHPKASEEELELLAAALGVRVDSGTVNGGFAFPRTGIVSGPGGTLVGDLTTGPELMILQQALGLES